MIVFRLLVLLKIMVSARYATKVTTWRLIWYANRESYLIVRNIKTFKTMDAWNAILSIFWWNIQVYKSWFLLIKLLKLEGITVLGLRLRWSVWEGQCTRTVEFIVRDVTTNSNLFICNKSWSIFRMRELLIVFKCRIYRIVQNWRFTDQATRIRNRMRLWKLR